MLTHLPNNWQDTELGKTLYPHFCNALAVINKNLGSCLTHGVIINEDDPTKYFSSVLACLVLKVPTFLCNPKWKEAEWKEISLNLTSAFTLGNSVPQFETFSPKEVSAFQNCIMIPTGGTSGGVKFTVHKWESLIESAQATKQFLGIETINSVCCMPIHHVSGFMQYVRSILTNGTTLHAHWKDLDRTTISSINNEKWVISLVPTQLKRLLASKTSVNWLKQFHAIFIGGAASPEDILQEAQSKELSIVLTYGMTETASMISALNTEDFHKGMRGIGQPLPHANINIDNNNEITISAKSLFYGYFPHPPQKLETWNSHDEGYIDKSNHFHIIGRRDRIIITGGEKVDPHEIERVAMSADSLDAILVSSFEDPEWGERVVAFYRPKDNCLSESSLEQFLKDKLEKHKIPKDWIRVDQLPLTPHGKFDKNNAIKLWKDSGK